MPSKDKRVRVERGLYRVGSYYHACAAPPGSRTVMWRALGQVGLMEARRLRDEFAAEVQGAQPVVARTRASFGELAGEWLAEQRARLEAGEMSPRTFESYEMALRRHVLPVFGSRQVRSVTVEHLVDWVRRLRAAGYAPHSVHNYWAPINLVLRYAVRHGVLAGNPADRLTSSERPKPGSGRKRFLERHEMQRLLDAAPDRYRVALECGLFSGLRLSELLGLVWGDVDLRGDTLRVRYQMGRDGNRRPVKTAAARRDVILMRELAGELRRLCVSSPFSSDIDLVFCSATGGRSAIATSPAEDWRRPPSMRAWPA